MPSRACRELSPQRERGGSVLGEEGGEREELYFKLDWTRRVHREDTVPCEMARALDLYPVATAGREDHPPPETERDREGLVVEEDERVLGLDPNRDKPLTARGRRERRGLVDASDHPPSARREERREKRREEHRREDGETRREGS